MILLSLLIASSSARAADAVSDAQSMRDRIAATEVESRDVLNELYLIQKKVKDISKQRARLTGLMLSSDGDAKTLAQSLGMLEKRLASQRAQLAKRMALLYRWNSPNLLPFMFSSASAGEFERNLRFIGKLSERDFEYLSGYQRTLNATHLERTKLKAKVRLMLGLKNQIEEEEKKMKSVFQHKTELLARLNQRTESGLKALKNIREQHPELESLLHSGFFEKRGALMPPVSGHIESEYGTVVDHTYWFRLLNKGWRYKSASSPVHSVFSGEVGFAGKLPGYGSAIVVDHGDHYYTVYGWMENLKVAVGDKVTEGQIIGRSGQRLYFEIRHFSDAIDPSDWIKDAKRQYAAASSTPGGRE